MSTALREDERPPRSRDLIVVTLWMAAVTGLVEAAGSMVLMRAGQLPGAWWDLFWASPLFDVLLFGTTGVFAALAARLLRRPPLGLVLTAYGFLTASIWFGLALPYQVHIAALVLLSLGCGVQLARVVTRRADTVLRFWARTLPLVLGATAVTAVIVLAGRPLRERVATGRLPPASPGAPSVVLIVIDALRGDHLSTNGYPRDTGPTLTRLAAEGASFQAAFSTSPYTAPSHASLLTGLHPSEHGVQWIERRPILADAHPTIAEAMATRGYRTAAISANRFWFTREQGFGRGFLHFEDNFHALGDALMRTAYGRKLEEWVLRRLFEDYPWRRVAASVTDAAADWVAKDHERPFFLVLNYFDVHDPYLAPGPYRGRFSSVAEPGGILNSHQGRYDPELTLEELRQEIDAYDGAITYVDSEIGRLLGELEALGREDLIVVVTSDHGEAFGEHGAYIHANSLYLEEIHVPLILWSPSRVPAGFRTDVPVTNASLPSTILGLVDGRVTTTFGVLPLSPLWQSGSHLAPAWPIAQMEHWPWNLESSPSHYGAIASVLDAEYHLIRNDSLGDELYRWRVDPLEVQDLADSLPTTVSTLSTFLEALDH
jgi:arylsulfatase A-like enzyme